MAEKPLPVVPSSWEEGKAASCSPLLLGGGVRGGREE